MLYLVKCDVAKSYYMGETVKTEMIHIVEAESEQDAMDKVQNHYLKKDSPYSVSHWVNIDYCNEVIT